MSAVTWLVEGTMGHNLGVHRLKGTMDRKAGVHRLKDTLVCKAVVLESESMLEGNSPMVCHSLFRRWRPVD